MSASGRTPYVLGALEAAAPPAPCTVARRLGPTTPSSARIADHEIAVVVGPEFIAGSTRLKAGTAQKLVLNTISTVSMIRLGKTFGNLMVDVARHEREARGRAHRESCERRPARRTDEVDAALDAADGSAKVAIVSCSPASTPRRRASASQRADGNVRAALSSR